MLLTRNFVIRGKNDTESHKKVLKRMSDEEDYNIKSH